jgi:hypothetical protein
MTETTNADTADTAEAPIEASEFETRIAQMGPEHFARVSSMVSAEATKRDDPIKRLGGMNDREFAEQKEKLFGR